jgi:hypothetical protein
MCALAEALKLPDANVRWFSKDEERRILAFPIPGEKKGGRDFGDTAIYYPRRPVESPTRWFADHAARLRSLERAEGMP